MLAVTKRGWGTLCIVMLVISLSGCRENTAAPENNDFSYLEPESTKKPIAFKEDSSISSGSQQSDKTFKCSQSNIDLVGTLNRVEYYGPPGYGKTPARDQLIEGLVLKTGRNIELYCNNQGKVSANEILLEIPKDMPFEHLVGGNILARGQLELSDNISGPLPMKMQVLRMQSVQPSLQ